MSNSIGMLGTKDLEFQGFNQPYSLQTRRASIHEECKVKPYINREVLPLLAYTPLWSIVNSQDET